MLAGFAGGHPQIVRFLLDFAADPNARDEDGNTPLMWAAWGKGETTQAMRMLIDAGADAKAKNLAGETHEAFLSRSRNR